MDKERAIEVIENLRDYAFENWDDAEYGKELDEIGKAVKFIKSMIADKPVVGSAEIDGKKYMIMEEEKHG